MRTLQLALTVLIIALIGINGFLLFTPKTALCDGCNVIIISVETLGMNEVTEAITPNLVSFSERYGIVFERAYAQAPWTVASHAALMTGRYPWDLGIWEGLDRIPDRTATLASRLEDVGYETALFSNGFVQDVFGFGIGFDQVYGSLIPGEGIDTLQEARTWISEHETQTPYFLFVHTDDAMLPYGSITTDTVVAMHSQEGGPTPADAERMYESYRAELRRADAEVGSFLEQLQQEGLLEHTIVIVTSGNGGRFLVPSEVGLHPGSLSEETLHVPLIFSIPNVAPAHIRATVETRSLPATVLTLTGIPYQAHIGESLVPYIQATEDFDRTALAATAQFRESVLRGLQVTDETVARIAQGSVTPTERLGRYQGPYAMTAVSGELKVVRDFAGKQSVFDIVLDPLETKNLFGANFLDRQDRVLELMLQLVAH